MVIELRISDIIFYKINIKIIYRNFHSRPPI